MALSIMVLFATLSKNDTQQNDTQHNQSAYNTQHNGTQHYGLICNTQHK
jgi:hypothetical protein